LTGANDSWSINKYALKRSNMVNDANAVHTTPTRPAWLLVRRRRLPRVIAKVDFGSSPSRPPTRTRTGICEQVDITVTFTIE
jgi:hypothetical protein